MALSPPQYEGALTDFIGDLRSRLFQSQRAAAEYFGVTRPTISRYENGVHLPPVAYLAALIHLLVERQEAAVAGAYRRALLTAANQAIRDYYRDQIFESWAELAAVAEAYLAERRNPTPAAKRQLDQKLPVRLGAAAPPLTPAEAPPLPHFYVERRQLQRALIDMVKGEAAHTLVLWGQGGTGKSGLAAWLANTLRSGFPDGQIWLVWPDHLRPEESVAEAQTQLARSLGVELSGLSLPERAGQLRTLLRNRRCLIVVDDVWITAGLEHLQVTNEQSCLLLTSRYKKVADVLEAPYLHITGMTVAEGLTLLTKWAGYPVTTAELVFRLGGLPLALKLSGVQLRDEGTPAELLAYFQHNPVALERLDLDQPQNKTDSLFPCFDRSFNHLAPQEQRQFIRLGCFAGRFDTAGSAAIGGFDLAEARPILRRWHNLALLEREERRYQLHPLLRDYARQKLLSSPRQSQAACHRHLAYYVSHYLYHPQILDDVTAAAPDLADSWPDIIAGVKWAAQHAPQLATIAALLAHTERPALLEAIGPPLITAVERYLAELSDHETEQATLSELLGDLYLLSDNLEAASNYFAQSVGLWHTAGDALARSRVHLRLAGIHLLHREPQATTAAIRQAQAALAERVPVPETHLEPARWLFYWFDIIYSVFVKWGDLELLAQTIPAFVDLAQQTGQPLLEARGWHIYRLFYTTQEVPHDQPARQKGRHYGAKAAWLWRRNGEWDKALAEVMWTQEQTKGRRSRRMAEHFARRLSRATPKLSQAQLELIANKRIHRWLKMDETQRVRWLIQELPPPGSDDWQAVEDILSISTMGEQTRRIAQGVARPAGHPVSEPMWKILRGQRALPLAGAAAVALVKRYLSILEQELG